MSAAPQIAFDPAQMDLVTPEKYEREGYPHAEWTWLRQNDPVHWYEHPTVDPFWAITKHEDIVDIGKNPDDFIIKPRLAVFSRDVPEPPDQANHLLTMDPPEHAHLSRGHREVVHAAHRQGLGAQGRARDARGARRGRPRRATSTSWPTSRRRSRSR